MPATCVYEAPSLEEGQDEEPSPPRFTSKTLRRAAAVCLGLVACATAGSHLGNRAAPTSLAESAAAEKAMARKYTAMPVDPSEPAIQCPGATHVKGLGQVKMTNNKVTKEGTPASPVEIYAGNAVAPSLGGRSYFSNICQDGLYNPSDYVAIPLLGKTIQYTVDLRGAGCGCNVAFYLTSMNTNTAPTTCQDYYCDANSVCGVRCDEIDIMEANNKVWRSTLHLAEDDVGGAAGYGGTGPHTQTWTSNEYGPGSSCINTNKPFVVKAHFPVHNGGVLQGMMIELSQEGASCGEKGLTATVGWYKFQGTDGIVALTEALKTGMVPVISYWASAGMSWMDGQDINGENPCPADYPKMCPKKGPELLDFEVHNFTGFIHHSTMNLSPTPAPSAAAATATTAGAAGVAGTATAAAGGAPSMLPNGWMLVPYQGKAYYYNPKTQQTSWTRPTTTA